MPPHTNHLASFVSSSRWGSPRRSCSRRAVVSAAQLRSPRCPPSGECGSIQPFTTSPCRSAPEGTSSPRSESGVPPDHGTGKAGMLPPPLPPSHQHPTSKHQHHITHTFYEASKEDKTVTPAVAHSSGWNHSDIAGASAHNDGLRSVRCLCLWPPAHHAAPCSPRASWAR